jgi:uncharacterized cupredoxin-like copper-binding protein
MIHRASIIALLLLAAPARLIAEAGAPAAQEVTVVLSDYRFTPDHLLFRHGVAYRLLLENSGKELHEFTAPDFFKAVALDTPDALVPGGREVVLGPGQRKELRFVASTAGRFAMSCADHDWAGMTGQIVIE